MYTHASVPLEVVNESVTHKPSSPADTTCQGKKMLESDCDADSDEDMDGNAPFTQIDKLSTEQFDTILSDTDKKRIVEEATNNEALSPKKPVGSRRVNTKKRGRSGRHQ